MGFLLLWLRTLIAVSIVTMSANKQYTTYICLQINTTPHIYVCKYTTHHIDMSANIQHTTYICLQIYNTQHIYVCTYTTHNIYTTILSMYITNSGSWEICPFVKLCKSNHSLCIKVNLNIFILFGFFVRFRFVFCFFHFLLFSILLCFPFLVLFVH